MRLTARGQSPLPRSLYTAEQVGALDRAAIDGGIAGAHLMKRAGRAAFETLLQRFPDPGPITVYCGSGNNAGDGYVMAGLAAQRRLSVRVVQVGDSAKLGPDARQAYEFAVQEGVPIASRLGGAAPDEGLIVDALLGTGLKGAVRAPFEQAIEQINDAGLPVFAVDIPSGLNADTGAAAGVAVAATLTATFIGLKRGLFTGRGPALVGELFFDDLSVPVSTYRAAEPQAQWLDLSTLLAQLPPRAADAHKGDFGHVMVIGGDTGFGGAPLMAAEAAARTGAGLVSLATRPEHVAASLVRRPEVMACGVTSGQELEPWLSRPTVLVVGPGLGRSPWSEQMLQQALKTGLPLVLDADALNILAEGKLISEATRHDNWLITPHPGEAARLLGQSTTQVQADRFAAVRALQQGYGGAAILKGAGTLVAGPEPLLGVVTEGNPGMASGGMGDLLSGILGGLLAQGVVLPEAARLGACLHAQAADRAAARRGQRSLLASDLLDELGAVLGG